MSSFQPMIDQFLEVMGRIKQIPSDIHNTPKWPPLTPDAPVVLGFWAHPDDEILTGGALAIRLRRAGYRVVNVALTLGEPNQVERRRTELAAACKYLDIELLIPNEGKAFYHVVRKGKLHQDWFAVDQISKIITDYKPKFVMVHHDQDEHPDHVGVNRLVFAALEQILFNLDCIVVEGEWWRDMSYPNLQLEISKNDLEVLLQAAICHKGEMERNPYHAYLILVAYLNSQYGEVVTGWGDKVAPFDFSVMYRLSRFHNGKITSSFDPIQLAADAPLTSIL